MARCIQIDSLIIDGSNVIRAKGGSVKGLKACLNALKGRVSCKVFLDANILHVLKENGDAQGRALLEQWLEKYPNRVVMAPAGSRADEYILLDADKNNGHILSNDQFEPYQVCYPWLKGKGNRRHTFRFVDGVLMIPALAIEVKV